MVWYSMVWYGIVWHGMVYGMVEYGVVRYGMVYVMLGYKIQCSIACDTFYKDGIGSRPGNSGGFWEECFQKIFWFPENILLRTTRSTQNLTLVVIIHTIHS